MTNHNFVNLNTSPLVENMMANGSICVQTTKQHFRTILDSQFIDLDHPHQRVGIEDVFYCINPELPQEC